MLIDQGFTLVRPLAGGFDAWIDAGFPVMELPE
jgi:rhodanese-related sulfurtransferase